MEIVKIGKENLVNCFNLPKLFTAKVFYCMVLYYLFNITLLPELPTFPTLLTLYTMPMLPRLPTLPTLLHYLHY